MADMTTVLQRHRNFGDTVVYEQPGHTVKVPKIVVQKRHTPSGKQTVAEDSITVSNGAVGSDGALLPGRSSVQVIVRRDVVSIDPTDTSVADAVTLMQEIIASGNFQRAVDSQTFLLD